MCGEISTGGVYSRPACTVCQLALSLQLFLYEQTRCFISSALSPSIDQNHQSFSSPAKTVSFFISSRVLHLISTQETSLLMKHTHTHTHTHTRSPSPYVREQACSCSQAKVASKFLLVSSQNLHSLQNRTKVIAGWRRSYSSFWILAWQGTFSNQ